MFRVAAGPALLAVTIAALAVGSAPERAALAAYPPGENGKIAFDSNRSGQYDIWVMDADGSNQVNLTPGTGGAYPRWSPDGRRIAYELEVSDDNYDIWVMKADGSRKMQLTSGPGIEGGPVWSPDGTRITYHDGEDVWIMDADGDNQTRLTTDPAFDCCTEWSPDGTRIIFDSFRSGDRETWIMDSDGSDQVKQPGTQPDDSGVRFSPDSQMLVLFRFGDIYTMSATGLGRQNITNNNFNESSPSWTADGTRIMYRTEEFGPEGKGQIAIMDQDGGDRVNLSNSPGSDSEPDMQVLGNLMWGDVDCSAFIDPIDGLKLLRHDAGLEVAQEDPCTALGEALSGGLDFGDLDCNEAVDPIDALKTLRHDAGLEVAQPSACPQPGVTVAE